MADDPFKTIDLGALEEVTGGRYTRGADAIDPQLIQGIGELAKAVTAVGQGLAATKQQSDGQMMQLLQQMMQKR
ncbi:MAG TPA: hypothetical protein VMZ53_32275 [Kofleriaceae bacterium]|nr:hypothetical protein [Kofleriaceae bacterium]